MLFLFCENSNYTHTHTHTKVHLTYSLWKIQVFLCRKIRIMPSLFWNVLLSRSWCLAYGNSLLNHSHWLNCGQLSEFWARDAWISSSLSWLLWKVDSLVVFQNPFHLIVCGLEFTQTTLSLNMVVIPIRPSLGKICGRLFQVAEVSSGPHLLPSLKPNQPLQVESPQIILLPSSSAFSAMKAI